MALRKEIENSTDEIAQIRRELHQNPQTAYEEEFASSTVRAKLDEWGIAYETGWAETGIIATIEGKTNNSGKAIGLRGDMDALDIEEKSGQKWASKIKGKMHACGHDGHTSILLAAAKYLSETRNFDGTVKLIFQPAEEGRRGAYKMVEEGLFEKHPVDAVYGLHNWPWIPLGKASLRTGPMMANSDLIYIDIKGVGGHAAYPHKTKDPLIAATALVQNLQSILSRNVAPQDQAVLSITNLNVGTGAENIIADTAHISGSVRTYTPEMRDFVKKRIDDFCKACADAYEVEISYRFDHIIDAVINSEAEAEHAAKALEKVIGEGNVDRNGEMSMAGEDFGSFLMAKPGCFIFLGQGEPDKQDSPHSHGLHSPYYDFNDKAIAIGASWMAELVESAMPLNNP